MHNEHVVLYKKFKLWIAEQECKHLSQFFHYTELQKEINPNWTPFTQDELKYIDD